MENKDRINQNQVAEEDNKWMEKRNRGRTRQDESTKKHEDKNSESQNSNSQGGKEKSKNILEDEELFGLDAEFADPTETNRDYLQQPQSMSDELRSIYAGAPDKAKDHQNQDGRSVKQQNEQSRENRKNFGQAGYSADDVKVNKMDQQQDGRFPDTARGNYSQHNDYQDRQGYDRQQDLEKEFPHDERNRYSTGIKDDKELSDIKNRDNKNQKRNISGDENESAEFPSTRQNAWDDIASTPKGYGETDYDDQEIRRRQDEGQQPWDESDKDEENV